MHLRSKDRDKTILLYGKTQTNYWNTVSVE